MIVKDEGKNLKKCLESAKSLADEIIIVDAGSKDNTKEIATHFTDKIFDFKWNNNFSDAMNFSLQHATKEWILVLDADESISSRDIETIRKLASNKSIIGYRFLTRNYTNNMSVSNFIASDDSYEEGKNYNGWFPSAKIRLFQNNRNIKFYGMLHELVEDSIKKINGRVELADVPVHRIPSENEKAKKEVYLKICKENIKTNPTESSFLELGMLYKELENSDEAAKALQKALEINKEFVPAYIELGIILQTQKKHDDAIKIYRQALKIKPDIPEALFGLGICFFRLGMLDIAKENFEKALELKPNDSRVYVSLGSVYEKLQENENAIKVLQVAISLNPKNPMAYFNLGIALEKEGKKKEAIRAYESALKLRHKKSQQIINKISELKKNLGSISYSYSYSKTL